ncbi:MAG: NUDIX hydrolase [Bacteroidia bacterium]|nr:NUDIX hydrolase [Bacteroidia bacterium]MDW8157494.1 NUDIX hydrolase [Bacteroidia bacterium]
MKSFNLRVYGLWINSKKEILLVEEEINNFLMRKFPGGGLEWGEGILDCLYREWREETGLPILKHEHFYTTDFFQISAFNPSHQIISVYYLVQSPEDFAIHSPQTPMIKRFLWCPLRELQESELTFPIDRVVLRKLKASGE